MNFSAVIELERSVPSVNYIYKPGKNKRGGVYLYKDPKVEEFQEHLIEKGVKTDLVNLRDVEGVESLEVSIVFHIRKRFWNRDVSNMVKAVEDALVIVTGVDDSRTLKIFAEKRKTTALIEKLEVLISVKKESD